ncbi:MAG: crossover junction endodeoxyribonuclease RuvC [Prevotellaceae bacterium]|jgi:crossover junction endodeoxyribonuclease RuvC|nr:crossover junction endodeoxyribonuclease RuvC [Prevotellaceae bacterium]
MSSYQQERIILGIDPGTTIMGYGVLRVFEKKAQYITLGIVNLKSIRNHYLTLKKVFEEVTHLIEKYLPDELAIESPFFEKNVQSMLKLGRAQGVAITAAISHDIPIAEYAPLKIKMAITGQGRASKEQVSAMLCKILKIPVSDLPKELDATDGLAAAYCHYLQTNTIATTTTKYRNWKDFVVKNNTRIKKSTSDKNQLSV